MMRGLSKFLALAVTVVFVGFSLGMSQRKRVQSNVASDCESPYKQSVQFQVNR